MPTSIPAAFDYLLGLGAQATAGVPRAVVADGWSDSIDRVMFGVGAAGPPFFDQEAADTQVSGTPSWAGMPKQAQEDYTVPQYIYVGIGGTDLRSARLLACQIWDAWFPLFLADLSLGGALRGRQGAELSSLTGSSPRSADEAAGGRYYLLQFPVRCQSLL